LNWIWWFFLKKIQKTYNSQLRERYGDDPSTHPDFDSDLLMEAGSSDGPDKKIGSTGSLTLRSKTCGLLVMFQLLGALYQYRAPSLRSSWLWNNNMISSVKWSWRLDQGWVMIHAQLLFGRTVLETTSLLLLLLLLLQLRRYFSLILFLKHIKFVMNIWMNII